MIGNAPRLGVKFLCPYCQSESIVKSGKNCNGKQRYQCKYCHKRFITDYTYKAYLPNIDSKIIQLTKEGLGIRSTAVMSEKVCKILLVLALMLGVPQA